MLKSYFKVTIRSFLNQKYYSAINTLGLSLGLSACILIFLYVQDELGYERSFSNHDSIYRLVQDFPMGDHLSQSASVPFPAKAAMLEDFPDIEQAALIFRPNSWGNALLIENGEDHFYEDDLLFADPEFLNIYDFTFIEGETEGKFLEPNELILTQSAAKKYFGEENAMGKTLNLSGFVDMKVVGVIEDLPHNTHLSFSMLCSFMTYRRLVDNDAVFNSQWVWVAAWLYFTVDDPVAITNMREQLPTFVKKHYPQSLQDKGVSLHIQKADRIHLHSHRELEFKTNGNMLHVYVFSSISLLILLIAIINFMNLTTAKSSRRGKEVGLRKAMGASRGMLIAQFIGEAMLTSLLAMLIAIFFIYNLLPWYNEVTGKVFTMAFFQNKLLLLGAFGLLMFVGLASGIYPALVLSSFRPTEVLKGRVMAIRSSERFFRRALVVGQFVVSIALVICIGIVYRQLQFVRTSDLGFDKDQIMLIDMSFAERNNYGAFKNSLEAFTDIVAVTQMGGSIPGQSDLIEHAFVETGKPMEEQQWFSVSFVFHDFEKVFDVEFLKGHPFTPGNAVDSLGYVINETAAAALGWDNDDVIGRSLRRIDSGTGVILQEGIVIGLVSDYHYRPLYDPIKPMVMGLAMLGTKVCIKMTSTDISETVTKVEQAWKSNFPETPFRYSFLDVDFDALYAKEDNLGKTIRYFSILAIFIACLGLLGLSSYSTESRRKEIGIRKVNGASTFALLRLLTKEFSWLLLIAFCIAVPIAWYFGNLWLNEFAYKAAIGIGVYLIGGMAAFVFALITVSYHTIKAARGNPVQSLRHE
jgi:putative ABC transport system permease protein